MMPFSSRPQISASQAQPWLRQMLLATVALTALALGTVRVQAGDTEKAITRTPDDPAVVWGPCPAFLPKGCGLAVLHGDPRPVCPMWRRA